ncbi:unnamed protein product [Debaryomyces tyrocola]|nr:unnamed protein product [Debaryomyces tyrocola]
MGLKNTISSDNRNIKTFISIFPNMGLKKKVRLKKTTSISSDSIPHEEIVNTQPISLSRSSLSSSSASRTRRKLSSGTHSMRKVNRSQAKRISSGNIISSLQALKGINDNHSPLDANGILGSEEKLDSYAISVTSLIEDETSPYKIDITLENLTKGNKLRNIEGSGNNKALQLDTIQNPAHHGASHIFTEFNFTVLFKLIIHVMFYLFVLYIILKKISG